MPRRKRQNVQLGPKATSELFKPARLEVYEALQIGGPSSIAELAARLGRPADSLYYHVRKLVAIGVIEALPDEEREARGPGRRGAVYALVGRLVDVELNPRSRRSREAWAEGGSAVLRLAQRDFGRALESGEVQPTGARRNLFLRRLKLRLDAAQLREVNEHVEALNELLMRHAENTEGELHAITCVMTPLEERTER